MRERDLRRRHHRARPALTATPVAFIFFALLIASAVSASPGAAAAEPPPPRSLSLDPGGSLTLEYEGTPLESRRQAPDYDGRAAAPQGARGLLWIPRVLLAPVWVVSEYVIRRPLGAFATWFEKNAVSNRVVNALTFGSSGKVGIVPTALLDFGLRPSVGVYAFINDVPTDDDHLRLHFAWGGPRWLRFTLRERIAINDSPSPNLAFADTRVNLEFVFERRPDHLFYGVGAVEGDARAAAYERTEISGSVGLEAVFGELDGIDVSLGLSRNRFRNGDEGVEKADLGIDDLGDTSLIDGFGGYLLGSARVALQLDSRPGDLTERGTGFRVAPFLEAAADLGGREHTMLRYGADLGAFFDLDRRGRVLSLHQRLHFADPLGDSTIPFTELVAMGGTQFMRGFHEGRFRGRSTFSALIQYSYPVWAFLDGYAWYSVGNAFGAHLDGFSLGALAGSFGLGLRSNGDRDGGITFAFGMGTRRFDEGFEIENYRLVFGFQQGF